MDGNKTNNGKKTKKKQKYQDSSSAAKDLAYNLAGGLIIGIVALTTVAILADVKSGCDLEL